MSIVHVSSASPFPRELKTIIQENAKVNRKEKIHDALIDITIRKAFKTWAKEHEEFASRSPIIQQIHQEVTEIEMEELEGDDPVLLERKALRMIAFTVKTCVSSWLAKQDLKHLESQIETIPLGEIFNDNNLYNSILISEYLEIGLISEKCCENFLKANLFLRYEDEFQKSMPILEKLSIESLISLSPNFDELNRKPWALKLLDRILHYLKMLPSEEFIQILSIQNEMGKTLLHQKGVFKKLIPILLSLSNKKRIQILSIQDRFGNLPFHQKDIFKEAIPFLKKLSNEERIQILSIQDKFGTPPLHEKEVFKEAIPFLQSLRSQERFQILSIKDELETSPLHEKEVFKEAIPFLQSLSSKERIQILSIQNKPGNTPLHKKEIFKEAIPFLKKLLNQELIQILSIRDECGKTLLHQKGVFKEAVPFLKKLSAEDQVRILSIRNMYGQTPLHREEVFKEALLFLKDLSSEQCVRILSIKNEFGETPLHREEVFKEALPFLKDLSSEQRVRILSIKNEFGKTPIEQKKNFKEAVPFLKDLPSEERLQILFIKNKNEKSLFYDNDYFEQVVPLLLTDPPEYIIQFLSINDGNEFPIFFGFESAISSLLPLLLEKSHEQFVKLLSTKTQKGETFLHFACYFERVHHLMKKLLEKSPEEFFKLLSIKNNLGITPHDNLVIFEWGKPLQQALAKQYPEKQIELLSIKDNKGFTPLHYTDLFERAIPLLQSLLKWSPDQVLKLLTIKDNNGDTPLRYYPKTPEAEVIIQTLNIDLSSFINAQGLSRLDLDNYHFSESWMTKPKYDKEEQAFILSADEFAKRSTELNQEYRKQMTQLRADIDALWGAVNVEVQKQFIESNVRKRKLIDHYFVIEGKKYNSEEIFNELEKILKLMEDKTGWLGTPPADNVAALYTFYKSQLNDFKKIVEKLKEKNDVYQTVGSITSMIYPRVTEGLCATAYKRAIKQQRVILEEKPGSLTLDGMLDNAIINTFDAIIMEDIVLKQFKGNVHAMTHFRYAGSLESIPETLYQPVSLEKAQEMILQAMDLCKVIKKFLRQDISQETAFEWLKMNTPPDFGPEYHHCINEMKEAEDKLFKACEQQLEFLSMEKRAKVLEFFRYFRETSITPLLEHCHSGEPTNMLRAIFQRYPQIDQTKLSIEIKGISEDHIDDCVEALKEESAKLSKQYTKLPQREYMAKRRELNLATTEIRDQILAVLRFQKALEPLGLSAEEKLQILHVKAFFESQIKELAKISDKYMMEFSFNPREFGLPSQAVENARQNAYNAPFAGSRAALGLLLAKGVFEKIQG